MTVDNEKIKALKQSVDQEKEFYRAAHEDWIAGKMPTATIKQYRASYQIALQKLTDAMNPGRQQSK